MNPALAAIGAQDQPVGSVSLQQLDLVALIENTDLRRTKLVWRVQQADEPVADAPGLVVRERSDASGFEGEMRIRDRGTQRIGSSNLLQRRSPPARQ